MSITSSGPALKAATGHAATVLGRDDMGSLTPGARADLLVVDGDPLSNISDVRNVRCVWKDGEVVHGSGSSTRR